MKRTLLFCIVLIISVTISTYADVLYDIIDLGVIAGDTRSGANAINDNGQIVGWSINSSGKIRAVLFDSTGNSNNTDLGTLGGDRSYAYDINNYGDIVGYAEDNSDLNKATYFDISGGGSNHNLDPLNPYESYARSVNNNLEIVGAVGVDEGGYPTGRAAYFDGSVAHDLGASWGVQSYAYCINDNSEIVGSVALNLIASDALYFDPALGWDYAIISEGVPLSINNNGQMVGHSAFEAIPSATLFNPGGDNIIIGDYDSYAYSINDNSKIVGSGWFAGLGERAILFDPTGNKNNIILNNVIDPACGWTLLKAYDINNNGWIVGDGEINGEDHAYLLMPVPEPGTLVLLGLGMMMLRKNKKSLNH